MPPKDFDTLAAAVKQYPLPDREEQLQAVLDSSAQLIASIQQSCAAQTSKAMPQQLPLQKAMPQQRPPSSASVKRGAEHLVASTASSAATTVPADATVASTASSAASAGIWLRLVPGPAPPLEANPAPLMSAVLHPAPHFGAVLHPAPPFAALLHPAPPMAAQAVPVPAPAFRGIPPPWPQPQAAPQPIGAAPQPIGMPQPKTVAQPIGMPSPMIIVPDTDDSEAVVERSGAKRRIVVPIQVYSSQDEADGKIWARLRAAGCDALWRNTVKAEEGLDGRHMDRFCRRYARFLNLTYRNRNPLWVKTIALKPFPSPA